MREEGSENDRLFYQTVMRVLNLPMGEQLERMIPVEATDVRHVAAGLAYIIQALKEKQSTENATHIFNGRMLAALNIIDALLNGSHHPIWSFLRGCRAKNVLNRPIPLASMRPEAFIYGLHKAIMSAHNIGAQSAARLVYSELSKYFQLPITSETIRKKYKTLSRDLDNEANSIAEKLITAGGSAKGMCFHAALQMTGRLLPPTME